MRTRTIVLLSGGLDSAVNLKRAADDTELVLALTFDYGQKAARPEISSAGSMSTLLGVEHRVVELPWLARITKTALVSPEMDLPRPTDGSLEDPHQSAGLAASVWVPNRNGVFVAIAASFAEAMGAHSVVAGFNAEEAATFPDNSADFISACNKVLAFSTLTGVKLVSYTESLNKGEIVSMGLRIGAPLDRVWSCYGGGPAPCGECESCLRLARALDQAGSPPLKGGSGHG